jgi:hypothetical protein
MMQVIAVYIPNPERAVVPTLIQLGLVAVLISALYAYFRPRCGRRATIMVLAVAELLAFFPPVSAILAGSHRYDGDWVAIVTSYFELFEFAVCSFICLTVAGVLLFLAAIGRQTSKNDGKPEPPLDDPKPDRP